MADAIAAVATVALFLGALWWQARAYRARLAEFTRQQKLWERERADLLNRIMYMADRPWTPPPVDTAEPVIEPEPILYPESYALDE